jgi:predicted MFS family arabinose efflux permease
MTARSERWAIALVFAVHGAVIGSFGGRIPWIQEHLNLRPGALGLALLMPAIGAVTTMPFASTLIHRLGGRAATRLLIALWSLSLALPALAPSLPVLCVSLLIFGSTAGLADIAMNAQAVAIERELGRSIMSGLHGMWSIGGLLASGAGAIAAHAGIDARPHLAVAALILAAIGIAAAQPLLDSRDAERPPALALPSGPVLAIGLVTFCAIFAEVAGADWVAVFLRSEIATSPATAAAGYTVFALTMAAGRLTGDRVVAWLGPVRTVRICGLIAMAGAALVVVAQNTAVAMLAFGLIGLGIAVVVPLGFSAAGHAGPHPGQAIAGVATVAYGAGLAAPGAIGAIADATSLRSSFVVVAVLAAVIALGATVLRTAAGPAQQDAAAPLGENVRD